MFIHPNVFIMSVYFHMIIFMLAWNIIYKYLPLLLLQIIATSGCMYIPRFQNVECTSMQKSNTWKNIKAKHEMDKLDRRVYYMLCHDIGLGGMHTHWTYHQLGND